MKSSLSYLLELQSFSKKFVGASLTLEGILIAAESLMSTFPFVYILKSNEYLYIHVILHKYILRG